MNSQSVTGEIPEHSQIVVWPDLLTGRYDHHMRYYYGMME
jgi:hypothetical protein